MIHDVRSDTLVYDPIRNSGGAFRTEQALLRTEIFETPRTDMLIRIAHCLTDGVQVVSLTRRPLILP
jgi:hypothetical protein